MIKKLLLPLLSLVTFSAHAELNVAIEGSDLSEPVNRQCLKVTGPSPTQQFFGNKTLNLIDGSYTLSNCTVNGPLAEFGSFDVINNTTTNLTGHLIAGSNNSVIVDKTNLTKVTVNSVPLGESGASGLLNVSGTNPILRGIFSLYLLDGEYAVNTRGGANFGNFIIAGNAVTTTGSLTNYVNNTVEFDLSQLARVQFSNISELMQSVTETGLTPSLTQHVSVANYASGLRDNNAQYFPVGTGYYVTLTATPGIYGRFSVADDLSVTIDEGYLQLTTDGQIAFDTNSLPHIDIHSEDLSSTGDLITAKITWWGLQGNTRHYLVPDTEYTIKHRYQYGSVTMNAYGPENLKGALLAEGNDVHFDLCALNNLTFTPSYAGVDVQGLFLWGGNNGAEYTVSIPDGVYPRIRISDSTSALPAVEYTIELIGGELVLPTDFPTDKVTVTLEGSYCAAPDSDADGVGDDIDTCLETLPGESVDVYGCSVEQNLSEECDGWKAKNHGKFVSCVTRSLKHMFEEGLITQEERSTLITDAAHSK